MLTLYWPLLYAIEPIICINFTLKIFMTVYTWMCVCHVGTCMFSMQRPWCSCESQKTTSWTQFSPSSFMWIPGIELRLSGLHSRWLFLRKRTNSWDTTDSWFILKSISSFLMCAYTTPTRMAWTHAYVLFPCVLLPMLILHVGVYMEWYSVRSLLLVCISTCHARSCRSRANTCGSAEWIHTQVGACVCDHRGCFLFHSEHWPGA